MSGSNPVFRNERVKGKHTFTKVKGGVSVVGVWGGNRGRKRWMESGAEQCKRLNRYRKTDGGIHTHVQPQRLA